MPRVWVDRNRHTFLEYRDTGKVRHYVTMMNGSIETIQMTPTEFKQLEPCLSTPEHFANTYLKSSLDISRSARAILSTILKGSGQSVPEPSATSFSQGSVTLEQIVQENNWDAHKARKFLRKLVNKPGGRWAWPPEEAEKIVSMLKECFADEAT